MVLTQPAIGVVIAKPLKKVSIPLWFSRNGYRGEIAVMLANLVSIPLWFSRNEHRYYC